MKKWIRREPVRIFRLDSDVYVKYLSEKIASSDIPDVKALVNQPDTKPGWDNLPLFLLMKKSKIDEIRILVSIGANVNY